MEEGVVYVGSKPVMNYVLAVITQFEMGAKKVSLLARGKAISRAVDVAEMIKNRLMDVDAKVSIGTDVIESDGKEVRLSVIKIELKRKS